MPHAFVDEFQTALSAIEFSIDFMHALKNQLNEALDNHAFDCNLARCPLNESIKTIPKEIEYINEKIDSAFSRVESSMRYYQKLSSRENFKYTNMYHQFNLNDRLSRLSNTNLLYNDNKSDTLNSIQSRSRPIIGARSRDPTINLDKSFNEHLNQNSRIDLNNNNNNNDIVSMQHAQSTVINEQQNCKSNDSPFYNLNHQQTAVSKVPAAVNSNQLVTAAVKNDLNNNNNNDLSSSENIRQPFEEKLVKPAFVSSVNPSRVLDEVIQSNISFKNQTENLTSFLKASESLQTLRELNKQMQSPSMIHNDFPKMKPKHNLNSTPITHIDDNLADICLTYEQKNLKYINFVSDVKYNVSVSHSISPLLFWVQLKEYESALAKLTKKINKFYDNQLKSSEFRLKKLYKNKFCAARFSLDLKWYRARLLKINEATNYALVYYVDYGNTEELFISDLRLLANEFFNEPALSTPFTLYQAMPADGQRSWSESSQKNFNSMILNRAGEICVKKCSDWPINFCKLAIKLNKEEDLIDMLKYMFDKKEAEIKQNSNVMTSFSDQMYIENEVYNFNLFDSNCNLINSNKSLSNVLHSGTSMVSYKVHTNPLDDTISKSRQHQHRSSNHKETTESKSIYKYMFHDLPKRLINFESNMIKFKFGTIRSPYEFYIFLKADCHEEYKKMKANLNKFYNENECFLRDAVRSNYDFIIENALCVAKSENKNKFVRVKIKDNYNETKECLVVFIDYGLEEVIHYENIFPMYTEHKKLPAHCIYAKMDLIVPNNKKQNPSKLTPKNEWSPEAKECFKSLARQDHYFIGQLAKSFTGITSLEAYDQLSLIISFQDQPETTLNNILVSKNFAKEKESQDDEDDDEFHLSISARNHNVNKNPPSTIEPSPRVVLNMSESPEEIYDFRQKRLFEYVAYQACQNKADNEKIEYDEIIKSNSCSNKDSLTTSEEGSKLLNRNDRPTTAEENGVNMKLMMQSIVEFNNKYNEKLAKPVKKSKIIPFNQLNSPSTITDDCGPNANAGDWDEVVARSNSADINCNEETAKQQTRAKSAASIKRLSSINELKNDNAQNLEAASSSDRKFTDQAQPQAFNFKQNNVFLNKHFDEGDPWNFLEKEYNSAKNIYGFDDTNVEKIVNGYETKLKANACRIQRRYGKCSRPGCPFNHDIISEEIVLKNVESKIFTKVFENENFYQYDTVLIQLTSRLGENLFAANVIGHIQNTQFFYSNKLRMLITLMNDFYGSKKFHLDRHLFLVVGQLVAAKYQSKGDWLRAKIVSKCLNNSNLYQVYYVDIGCYETLDIRFIIPIQKRFLNFKYQTFHFRLAKLNTIDEKKSLESKESLSDCLRRCQSKVTLMHAIIKKSLTPIMEVYLFAFKLDFKKPILINKYLP